MKLSYHKELDGVRAIAALMVMFFHFFQLLITNDSTLLLLKKYAIFGQTGVSLFFVLSGFLITRILLATKETPGYFSNFYIRRALRIFPLYYFALLLFYFIVPQLTGQEMLSGSGPRFYYWTYLQNFAMTFKWPSQGPLHFWSLAVEEHFYLFWPLLIYFLSKRHIVTAVVVLAVVSILVRVLLIKNDYPVFYFTFSRMDELAIGALLAVLELNKKLTPAHSKKFILLFALVIIPTVAIWVSNQSSGNASLQIGKFILLSVTYFSLIGYIITLKESHLIKKVLRIKALSYTGKISYGLYVYHPLCYGLFSYFFQTQYFIVNLLGSFALVYITASLSYYLFEARFLSLKKYFDYNKREKQAAANPQ
jgi:peptidoglycan/LPS O-acetylase OafA/YrhL